MKGVFDTEG